MIFDNYEEELITFSIEEASLLAIRLLAVLGVFLVFPFILLYFSKFSIYFSNFNFIVFLKDCLLFFLLIIVGIILHELIHGAVWAIFVKEKFKAIKFGVLWKYLTPYCHCSVPLKVKHYIAGGIMPAIVLGVAPTLLAFFTGNVLLFFLGIYFTAAASGDFMIIYLLRNEEQNNYVIDHDSLPGCTVYRLKTEKIGNPKK